MLSIPDSIQLIEVDLRRQLEAQQALVRLAIHVRQYTDKSELFAEASRLALELTGAAVGYLYLQTAANPASMQLGESVHYERSSELLSPEFTSQTLPSLSHPPAAVLQAVGTHKELQFFDENRHLLMPLFRRNRVMAVLDLWASPDAAFDETDLLLLTDLVNLLDSTLQNQYLLAARTALMDLSQDLSAELDLGILLDKVARSAATIATAQASSILLLQPDKSILRFAAVHGIPETDREILRQVSVPVHGSVAGSVVTTRQPLINNNVSANAQFYPGVSDTLTVKTRALMAVPMIAQDRVIGVLEVVNQEFDDEFDIDDQEILSLFASQAAIAIQNARLLAERQASLTELRKLEQRKSQFIALASHELRTPLNLVSGYSTLLRDSLEKEKFQQQEEAIDSLEQIEQATSRLIAMVNNITSMYNLETGRTQLLLERKDLIEVIEKVLNEHKEWCRVKGITISFEPMQTPLYATFDLIEVNRILGNLIGNAVKFTPEGGKITISAMLVGAGLHSAYPPGERQEVLVAVSDTGPGIEAAMVDSIFERFAQVDNHLNRLQGGIGLGLPLAKALVEKHGGQLWVETERGQGSTFFFTLPTPK